MIRRWMAFLACAVPLAVTPVARAAKPTTQRFALTRYFYGYQADTRKPLPPGQPTRDQNGASLFAVQPMVAIGPWFGYGHAMWHRDNLTTMRRAGIDIALPVFRADTASLAGYAEQGLDSMAQALIELKRDRLDFPLIGMFYDTTSIGDSAKPLNVGTEAGKAAFYEGIRRFFRRVPEEFRALVQTDAGLACLVAVDTASRLTGVDGGLKAYCNTRFQQDFGRRLLWLGEADWKAAGGALDAYAFFNEGRALQVNADGPISVATIGPGYNDSGLPGTSPAVRARNAGLTMIDDWRSLFQQPADWILVETWNDFARGNAIAPSRAYGVRDQDQTMAGLLQFRNESGLITQALRVNAPEVAPPKAVVPIEVVVQNGSLEQWGRGNISFSASWYQDGKLVEEGPKVPVLQPVAVMGLMIMPVAAVTARGDGTPLPDGRYELRVEFFRASLDAGAAAFTPFKEPAAIIPISVGTAPGPMARLVTSDTSPYLMPGGKVTGRVVARNDGAAPWLKARARFAWRVTRGDGADAETVASGEGAPFTRDVAPGEITEASVLTLDIPAGVAPSAPGAEYVLTWDVVNGTERIPVMEAPGAAARRVVQIQPSVSIAHFPFGNSAPSTWEASTDQEIRAVVRNMGATTWKASDVKVGYHWYYWDGTEALWEGQRTALPRDVKPGEEAIVRFPATAPSNAGAYVFAVDVWDGTQWVSTLPATAGFDTSLAYVNVTGGNVRPLDLTGLFDIDGIAGELNPGDGAFADGWAYPGDQVPPDGQPPLLRSSAPRGPYPPGVAPVLYPAGYFGPVDTVGTQSLRRVAFRYPSKKDGDMNFMLARGQRLPLGVGSYNRVYVLGASTEDTTGTFRLEYADGTSAEAPMAFSAWTAGPKHGEMVGLECTYRRGAKGDDASSRAYLYVYEIVADPSRTLNAIVLPTNRSVRVCAITADQRPTFTLPPTSR